MWPDNAHHCATITTKCPEFPGCPACPECPNYQGFLEANAALHEIYKALQEAANQGCSSPSNWLPNSSIDFSSIVWETTQVIMLMWITLFLICASGFCVYYIAVNVIGLGDPFFDSNTDKPTSARKPKSKSKAETHVENDKTSTSSSFEDINPQSFHARYLDTRRNNS